MEMSLSITAKYYTCVAGVGIGGTIIALNIFQAYTGIGIMRIGLPIFVISCALVIFLGPIMYYYKTRLNQDVPPGGIEVETLAGLGSNNHDEGRRQKFK